ncbi:hypothetical protein L3Q82_008619 [Scortum barcoo]|uniref:Uncharacterized protein n=1 Tax=Scortum barcoo TaxID=214431 RepID=A0ACB8XCE2_9TELE|nr:hypothetical protein L3Q82_008619 [Scortum barcoo]
MSTKLSSPGHGREQQGAKGLEDKIGQVYFGAGQSSSTLIVKIPDTSKIKTTTSSFLPLPVHRPPVCACGREQCCVCTDFQSAADGPMPCARRQPSVS